MRGAVGVSPTLNATVGACSGPGGGRAGVEGLGKIGRSEPGRPVRLSKQMRPQLLVPRSAVRHSRCWEGPPIAVSGKGGTRHNALPDLVPASSSRREVENDRLRPIGRAENDAFRGSGAGQLRGQDRRNKIRRDRQDQRPKRKNLPDFQVLFISVGYTGIGCACPKLAQGTARRDSASAAAGI